MGMAPLRRGHPASRARANATLIRRNPFKSATMAKPLIEYYKEVLGKISYADQAVFRKELRKAFRRLLPEEREDLKQWFRSQCVCKVEGTAPHTDGMAAA